MKHRTAKKIINSLNDCDYTAKQIVTAARKLRIAAMLWRNESGQLCGILAAY